MIPIRATGKFPRRAAPKKKRREERKIVGHSSWMEKLKINIMVSIPATG